MIHALFEMVAGRATEPLATDLEWRELLSFADRTQLSLYLRGIPGLPGWLAAEIETRYRDNAARRSRLRESLEQVSAALCRAGIDFVLLKGFTHETGVSGDPGRRVQYDLDLLLPPHDIPGARRVLTAAGYAAQGEQSLSAEHSHPMVRPSNWSWRGNYFDPEMPIPVELHDSLWSPKLDRICAPGMDEFWARRCSVQAGNMIVPALAGPDRLAFAGLHCLRHILRHNARPAHVLELGRLLEAHVDDAPFWSGWRDLHSPGLRALETTSFQFAHEWFGCRLPEAVATEGERQPMTVTAWFRDFAWSPVANLLGPNKDTVWLHLALAGNWRDRVRIFCDRLAPLRLPHREESAPYRSRFLGRLRYHAGAFAPALASGVRWWWRRETASTASQISDWNRRRV